MAWVEVDVDLSEFSDSEIAEEYRSRNLDVDLSEFSDSEIAEEYRSRNLDDAPDKDEVLRTIHEAMKLGKVDEAYKMMYDYVRDVLGVAI